ncbi:MAG: hypothetical protein IJC78_01945 [Clostridia bacterium]|nr:hypothetical protein [Clostridia bacterium]
MGYQFSFADNTAYTATDVNNITKRLVSSGIADSFSDGVPYNLSAFNDMGTLLYTSGVVPETVSTLAVSLQGNTVHIMPGVAFFDDGAAIEVTAGGHNLPCSEGVTNYVYLKNNLESANECYPVCSATEPSGLYVPLAEISADGVVTDKRTYAKGKLPGYASVAFQPIDVSLTVPVENDTCEDIVLDVGNNAYTVMTVLAGDGYPCCGMYDFKDGSYFSIGAYSNNAGYRHETDGLYLHTENEKYAKAVVVQESGKIRLKIDYHRTLGAAKEDSFSIKIHLA